MLEIVHILLLAVHDGIIGGKPAVVFGGLDKRSVEGVSGVFTALFVMFSHEYHLGGRLPQKEAKIPLKNILPRNIPQPVVLRI